MVPSRWWSRCQIFQVSTSYLFRTSPHLFLAPPHLFLTSYLLFYLGTAVSLIAATLAQPTYQISFVITGAKPTAVQLSTTINGSFVYQSDIDLGFDSSKVPLPPLPALSPPRTSFAPLPMALLTQSSIFTTTLAYTHPE